MALLSYRRHRFTPPIIQQAIWLYLRFTLSYRDVEELLAARGLDISYETVRRWVLAPADLLQCQLAAFVVQLLEPVEAGNRATVATYWESYCDVSVGRGSNISSGANLGEDQTGWTSTNDQNIRGDHVVLRCPSPPDRSEICRMREPENLSAWAVQRRSIVLCFFATAVTSRS
jgi:hypothetical protein